MSSPSRVARLAGRVRLLAPATLVLVAIGLSATLTLAQTPAHTTAPAKGRAKPTRPHKPVDGGAQAAAPTRADKVDGGSSESVSTRTLDGGAKVFRFGELEIEGRLKNPQLVFFLRRVRAEFAAGDLGHRSFLRELDETKLDPNF